MEIPDHFMISGSRGYFRLVGDVSLDAGVELVTQAILFARTQNIGDLLVNVTELTGFASPSIVDRYLFVVKWAHAAQGKVRMAIVARAEMIDQRKFGATVAANRGLVADVFTTEGEAVAWLDIDEKR